VPFGPESPEFPCLCVSKGLQIIKPLLAPPWCSKGQRKKYGKITHDVKIRLEHELSIIEQLGYEDYFLVVWDLVNFAARQNIRHAGRGSAADSAVAYCLGITGVDPIAHNLLFERFMSLERGEKPDIDVDFDARRRTK